ncbi:MAG TPA: hypothetical protein VMX94_01875 [Armatimonadota bacterium]|nr:hypothetical protein [Armatimonadota bacterium]
MRKVAVVVLCALVASSMCYADAPKKDSSERNSTVVTFSATDEKVSEIAKQICKQVSARIAIEKTADVKVTASVEDIKVEDALNAICKAGKLQWRKIYLRVDSPLLKKPDTLAATVRLMAGLQFPDLLIEQASTQENLVYLRPKAAVDAIPTKLRKDMGMVTVYLITNDEAAKVAEEKADSRAEKYIKFMKESMKLFMEMTPEEREQAMASGAQFVQSLDPSFMAEMTRNALKMSPEMMGQMMQSNMNIMFSMSPEDRRALMRMQMQASQLIPPELRELLQEDAKAVMKELEIGQKSAQE